MRRTGGGWDAIKRRVVALASGEAGRQGVTFKDFEWLQDRKGPFLQYYTVGVREIHGVIACPLEDIEDYEGDPAVQRRLDPLFERALASTAKEALQA